ncbi:MAG: DegT/DnrJ/EryC1/StrS family aminotransferase [Haliscomenobacter sp.]|nr:DegT/DnrJ/EryC1/StrS family aminotransferase [Haliscomenobacter sp.]
MFFIKCPDTEVREQLLHYLEARGIQAASHYAPLSCSPAGRQYGRIAGEDQIAVAESLRLLRLPLYPQLQESEVERVAETLTRFFKS